MEIKQSYTLYAFNLKYDLDLTEEMGLDLTMVVIEDDLGLDSYYASHRLEDIEEAAHDEGIDPRSLYVYQVGDIYFALHHEIDLY